MARLQFHRQFPSASSNVGSKRRPIVQGDSIKQLARFNKYAEALLLCQRLSTDLIYIRQPLPMHS